MQYALSGGHKKTLEAAQIILDQNGNAVDAAIAAYMVSFIAEPCMASIGAGGFAMVNDNHSIKVVDFFCQTPRSKRPINQQEFYPVTVDFGNTKEDFHVGKGSVAIPGAIAGIYKLHELYGSLPMKVLFEPALEWAKRGIKLDKFQAYDFQLLKDIFSIDPSIKHLFFDKEGELKKEGAPIIMGDYADFIDVLGHEGRSLFYEGEISATVSKDMLDGGHITRSDFEQYNARVRDPIQFDFLGKTINTVGFPSVGGMLLSVILNDFRDSTTNHHIQANSIEHFQELVKSFSKAKRLNNDPRKISQYLIDNFGIRTHSGFGEEGHKWGGTSHFNIIDKKGMTISLTTSIGEGSGYFIPGTDMQMNNMLGEEALMPNGFHNWDTNVRLQSMMSPTIISNTNGHTEQCLGSGGAGRIPYALAQSIIYDSFFDLDPEASINKPRLHLSDHTIECESGFDVEHLPNINIWNEPSLYFGGVNAITKKGDSYIGTADNRRFGAVINK